MYIIIRKIGYSYYGILMNPNHTESFTLSGFDTADLAFSFYVAKYPGMKIYNRA